MRAHVEKVDVLSWNNSLTLIHVRDDRVSSLISNRMEHYPCRHMKKRFIPWLWTIRKSSPLVMDQESLELRTRAWNIPTYLTYPNQHTYRSIPIGYGTIFPYRVHNQTIEEYEPMPIIPPNSHPLRHHRWDFPVLRYHKIMVIYLYPFLVVITQLFSWMIFINDCIRILTGSPG